MRLYLNWPIFLTILLICMNLSILTINKTAAGLMAIFVLFYAVIAFLLYYVKKPLIAQASWTAPLVFSARLLIFAFYERTFQCS